MNLSLAVGDFRAVRRRAAIEEILARLRGTFTGLLSFEEVREKLGGVGQRPRGLQDIPLVVSLKHPLGRGIWTRLRSGFGDLEPARRVLQDNGVVAEFYERRGQTAAAILDQAAEAAADMVLMGSYGHGPLVEAFLGSTVDDGLRGARVPVLLCT